MTTTDGRPVILVSAYQDGIKCEITSYLGGKLFQQYRDAVVAAGATWKPSAKANILDFDRLPTLKQHLDKAGFAVAIDDGLRDSLTAAALEAAQRAEEGRGMVAEVEGRLADQGLQLYPYQRDGVRWLAPRQRAGLFDEMGLGKTVQALCAMEEGARALVVAPAAVALNWVAECKVWRPDLRPSFFTGRANWRWPLEGELLVTTYGSLPTEDAELVLAPAGVYLISDESHLLKGGPGRKRKHLGNVVCECKTPGEEDTCVKGEYWWKGGVQRVRRFRIIRDMVQAGGGRVWLLSGTPLVNRPPELWNVLEAAKLAKDAFGSRSAFVEMFHGDQKRFGMEWGSGVADEAPLALQKVALRRNRIGVLPDLPRKRREVDTVQVSDDDAIRACDELVALLAEHGETVDALADMGRLANEVRAVVFELLSKVRAALAAAKIPAMLDYAKAYEDEELPVVVFCAHLQPLRTLAARDGWGLIDGSVSAERRAEYVADFQAGKLRGIACSFKAGGVGITLTQAHHVMCVDLPWTPADLTQAEDRCCRIGQDADSVHVRVLAADHPVDERVAELMTQKAALIEATVEASAVEYVEVDDRLQAEADSLAEMAEQTSDMAAKIKAEQERKREEERQAARLRGGWARGEFTPNQVPPNGKFRAPSDPKECHAARAMIQLAADDSDWASSENGIGFSKQDTEFGHSLADTLKRYGRLSDRQWPHAVRLAHKYRRQVGEAPQQEVAR